MVERNAAQATDNTAAQQTEVNQVQTTGNPADAVPNPTVLASMTADSSSTIVPPLELVGTDGSNNTDTLLFSAQAPRQPDTSDASGPRPPAAIPGSLRDIDAKDVARIAAGIGIKPEQLADLQKKYAELGLKPDDLLKAKWEKIDYDDNNKTPDALRATLPDGNTTIALDKNGLFIGRKDGSSEYYDFNKGTKTETRSDGTTVEYDSQQRITRQSNKDGTRVTHYKYNDSPNNPGAKQEDPSKPNMILVQEGKGADAKFTGWIYQPREGSPNEPWVRYDGQNQPGTTSAVRATGDLTFNRQNGSITVKHDGQTHTSSGRMTEADFKALTPVKTPAAPANRPAENTPNNRPPGNRTA